MTTYTLNGRPAAPQFKQIKTEAEFQKFMRDADNGARYTANEFMRLGKSKWIVRALQEGWSDILRHVVYQLARKDMLEYGDFPSIERLNGLVIDQDDHKKFRTIGRRSAA